MCSLFRCCRFLLLVLFLPLPGYSAEPRQAPTEQEQARTLVLLNQPVVMLQATFGLTTPEERVQRIVSTLRDLSVEDLQHPVITVPLTRYQQQGVLFTINNKPFMLLSQADLDEGDDLSLSQAAQRVQQRFEVLRHDLIEQYSPHYLLLSLVKSLGATLLLVLAAWVLWRSLRSVRRFYAMRSQQAKHLIPARLRSLLGPFEVRLYVLFITCVFLIGCYWWLSWILRLFPWTRIWGMDLGNYAINFFQQLGSIIISALPGLAVVLVIFAITGFIIRLLNLLLHQVENGTLSLPGLHPETVGVTRKLIAVAIWLFALSAAYPFLPGADSLAFKGISVFFGLMLTLGSAGVMNHAMSGLVLTYSRALRKGDVIRLAEHEGVVSEIGMLATKILTREDYEVTVPNAVVVSGKIVNLSSGSRGAGVNLTTSVTIGYDTPWRQVHAMLELAASRTEGVKQDAEFKVRQLSLMDWYIAYELQVRIGENASLAGVRSRLHENIQDVFNQFDVQIMSPNFISQPDHPVVVSRDKWHMPPARKEE